MKRDSAPIRNIIVWNTNVRTQWSSNGLRPCPRRCTYLVGNEIIHLAFILRSFSITRRHENSLFSFRLRQESLHATLGARTKPTRQTGRCHENHDSCHHHKGLTGCARRIIRQNENSPFPLTKVDWRFEYVSIVQVLVKMGNGDFWEFGEQMIRQSSTSLVEYSTTQK
jgi:hypothetical protein